MNMKEEKFGISSDKQLIFSKLFEMLSEFHRVCIEHNLTYSLWGGTLIGAVRENGFIPWDDDVDVIMMRKDYDLLQVLASQGVFDNKYFLQSPLTDEGSPRLFLRLRDSSTTSISNSDSLYKMNQGMFIDIFPADYFPNSKLKRNYWKTMSLIAKQLSGGYSRYYSKIGVKGDSLLKKIEYIFAYPFYKFNIFTSKKMFNLFNNSVKKYNEKECNEIADSFWMALDSNCHYKKSLFENGVELHKFESGFFFIFKDYDEILTQYYGDYMTPKKEPTCHGALIQRVDISYVDYIRKFKSELMDEFRK